MGRTVRDANNLDIYLWSDFFSILIIPLYQDGYDRSSNQVSFCKRASDDLAFDQAVMQELEVLPNNAQVLPEIEELLYNPYLRAIITFEKEVGGQTLTVRMIVSSTTPVALILKTQSSKYSPYSFIISSN